MNIRIFLIIILFLTGLQYIRAQESDTADTCQIVYIPLTPEQKLDSIRYVLDSLLTKENYTQTRTVTKTVRSRGKRRKVTQTYTSQRNFLASCCIYDLTADSMLYTRNAEQMMIPASTQKMYVAAAMLTKYGKGKSLDIAAFTDGKEKVDSLGNIFLDGNIYITTPCDPTLTSKDARRIAEDIESWGFDSINGRIIQCVSPKTKRVKLAEDSFASSVIDMLLEDSVLLSYIDVHHSEEYPTNDMLCLSRHSTPLDNVLERMLRNSNNTYAECMLLNILDDNENWTYEGCKETVSLLVEKIYHKYNNTASDTLDIPTNYYYIADGSGLSHSNKTSAHSQIDLLRYIHSNKKVLLPVLDHLPTAGVIGTISRRMTSGNAYKNVRAKTGTVNMTTTLSGYLTAANGHELAFTILFNNCSDKSFSRRLEDKICEIMADVVW